ncbi:MAG: dTDP-4-dehydrorhamnose 3,5-epimerase [Nitrospirales bacterium]
MKFLPTRLPEVLIVEPDVYRDQRGWFLETYHVQKYQEAGILPPFVQDNCSSSVLETLRGLHFQMIRPQGKLIRVIRGEIFDVAVDIRKGSPTFASWVGVTLSSEDFRQIYVPMGFAHGFCVLSDVAEVEYKCTDVYAPGGEVTIRWNDPRIGIQWPIERPLLSTKDAAGQLLDDLCDHLPDYQP